MKTVHDAARLVVDMPGCKIYHGLAEDWPGAEPVDLVFTNPYGPLPTSLWHHPMIIHQWRHRKQEAEAWCGNVLDDVIGQWNKGREVFWCANIAVPVRLDLSAFVPEKAGWYPEDLVRKIFDAYILPGQTVWDGFCGRGTIARVASEHGVNFVGVEQLSEHIAIARTYLELPGA